MGTFVLASDRQSHTNQVHNILSPLKEKKYGGRPKEKETDESIESGGDVGVAAVEAGEHVVAVPSETASVDRSSHPCLAYSFA